MNKLKDSFSNIIQPNKIKSAIIHFAETVITNVSSVLTCRRPWVLRNLIYDLKNFDVVNNECKKLYNSAIKKTWGIRIYEKAEIEKNT